MSLRALALALLLAAPAGAAELDGLAVPDRVESGGATLVLNGMATRTYSLLRVKVYAAALHLETATRDGAEVLGSSGPKLVTMRYLQPVGREDAAKAWRHYLEANCTGGCRFPAAAADRFAALLRPVAKGDVQAFAFAGGRVELSQNGQALGSIDDPAFARLLLATWVGETPTSEAVRRGLLAGGPPR